MNAVVVVGDSLEIDHRTEVGVATAASGDLLFAQITDIHIGFEPGNPEEANQYRLNAVLDRLTAMDPAPAFVLATGDLVEGGSVESYQRLRKCLDALPFPVFCCLGNHDKRAPFRTIFPETPTHAGLVQYVIDDYPLRIIVLDTMSEHRHGGEFDDVRADWLDAELSASTKPTLLAMHHPPTPSGIDWLTAEANEPWVIRLRGVIEKHHEQVVAIIAGHYHRPMVSVWTHTSMFVCPSVAPLVALDLRDMNVEHPDNRAMIVDEPPSFALHTWTENTLTSYVVITGTFPVLARHNERTKGLVAGLIAERSGSEAAEATESARD